MSRFEILALPILSLILGACRSASTASSSVTPNYDPISSQTPVLVILEKCALPCWAGITPGETTLDDAIQILEHEREFPTHAELEGSTDVSYSQWLSWDHSRLDTFTNGSISVFKGVVQIIKIDLREPTTVGDLIKQFGEPSSVGIDFYLDEDYPCREMGYGLFFSRLQTVAIGAPTGDSINAASNILGFQIYPPYGFGIERGDIEWEYESTLRWQGYIDYCTLIGE